MPRTYNRKDHLYKKAKEEGYRSRAAYKLQEIQKKYQIIRKNNSVLDLGCFPGGWLQVAYEIAGKKSKIVGIDLKEVDAIENVHILKADLQDGEHVDEYFKTINVKKFNVIISDMSSQLTGINERDQVASAELFELALEYCEKYLKEGGNFVCKIFPGEETDAVYKKSKKRWGSLLRKSLSSSRTSSNELYIIGKNFSLGKDNC